MTLRCNQPRVDRRRAVTPRLGDRAAVAACAAQSPPSIYSPRQTTSIYRRDARHLASAGSSRAQCSWIATAPILDAARPTVECQTRHLAASRITARAVAKAKSPLHGSAVIWLSQPPTIGPRFSRPIDRTACFDRPTSTSVAAEASRTQLVGTSIAVMPVHPHFIAHKTTANSDHPERLKAVRSCSETMTAPQPRLERCDARLLRHHTCAGYRDGLDWAYVDEGSRRRRTRRHAVIVVHRTGFGSRSALSPHNKQQERWSIKVCRMGPVGRTRWAGIPRCACHTRSGRR